MSENPAKLALVTGGVRRVGAHIAANLAKAGYSLALHGHKDAEPESKLLEILLAKKTQWAGFAADFSDQGAAVKLLDDIVDHFGRAPDLIVNNAAIFGQDNAAETDSETLEKHLRINMMMPVLLATELAKRDFSGDRAAIIHILDQRIINPHRDQLSYTLSKQALAQSVRTLAIACADRLRVNGVAPGLTLTAGEYGEEQLANITSMMPLERLSNCQDIADAILYFAQAEAVTGQIICVDGGANLKCFDRDFVHLGK
ncbi:hypothetical protein MNBD_ALPHA04-1585 [hydrothermal vent metagenome]|uniref:FolM Alternative dihydrofolate reductase 1 n=1 Tax=hydrothermal vent metagenome TaxID=652676 RepID=A0A3B0RBL7_9ZZZZ